MSSGWVYEVRPATDADLSALANLRRRWLAESQGPAGVPADPDFETRLAQWWQRMADRRHTWIATRASQAIGMAAVVTFERMPEPGRPTARWGYVSQVWVDPGCRRHGVGGALLAQLADWARGEGLVRLVVNSSEAGRGLYAAHGFHDAGLLARQL